MTAWTVTFPNEREPPFGVVDSLTVALLVSMPVWKTCAA
jgi:hypothetical protein